MPKCPISAYNSVGPGDHQKDRAQHHKAMQLVDDKEMEGIPRENRRQHLGVTNDLRCTGDDQKGQPNQNYRPEQAPHPRRTMALDQKQADENGNGHGNHIRTEYRSDDTDAFDSAQNGNGRSDHAVPIQQTGRKKSQGDDAQPPPASGGSAMPADQGGQGHNPAFPVVVRPENEYHVFKAD